MRDCKIICASIKEQKTWRCVDIIYVFRTTTSVHFDEDFVNTGVDMRVQRKTRFWPQGPIAAPGMNIPAPAVGWARPDATDILGFTCLAIFLCP